MILLMMVCSARSTVLTLPLFTTVSIVISSLQANDLVIVMVAVRILRGPRVVLVRASGRWLTILSSFGERIVFRVLVMTLGLGRWFNSVKTVVIVNVVPLVRRWLRKDRNILLQMRLVISTAIIRLLMDRLCVSSLQLILGRIMAVSVLLVVRTSMVSILGGRRVRIVAEFAPTTLVPLVVTPFSALLRQLARLTLTGATMVILVLPMPAVLYCFFTFALIIVMLIGVLVKYVQLSVAIILNTATSGLFLVMDLALMTLRHGLTR